MTMYFRSFPSISLMIAMLIACWPAAGQDWPQWRGPGRDGRAQTFEAPRTWPSELRPVWRLEVGTGHSSPILSKDVVYVLSREEDDEAIRAVELSTGRLLWRTSYPAPYEMSSAATAHGKGPKSTPAVAAGRLHALGISGILTTVDKATGELLWRRTVDETHAATSPYYGTAMSPMVDGKRLIVHVGGHHDGALMALDPATGTTIWSLEGDGPAYASPIIVEIAARRQVVTQTDRHVVGVDAESGELLWKMPFTTEWDQNAITPVLAGNRLILAGLDLPTRAWELAAEGPPTEIWSRPDLPLYMASPVLFGDRLFGLSHKRSGQLFAVDVANGRSVLASPGRDGENVALVLAADHLFVLNERAELTVLDPRADTLRTVARYDVADTATWAHPIVTESGVVVKDATTLALLSFEDVVKHDETSP